MKLLRPSESTLCAIFLFFFVNGDLTHLELGRGIDLRGKFLILRIASLGRVCWTDLNWAPWSAKSLAKKVVGVSAWLKWGLILRGVGIKGTFFWNHRLLMLSWEIVRVIDTRCVGHCWSCSVRLGFGVS